MNQIVASLLALSLFGSPKEKMPTYRTAPIGRTDIVSTVEATGTVTPIKKVEVGAQVNGKIVKLYVDYNSVVTNGQVVAEIDPLVYRANYESAVAQLHQNEANVMLREATLAYAEKTLARKQKLRESLSCSEADLDSAIEARDSAVAQLAAAKASVEQSKASVSQAKANLDYCTIVSPVNGVVITRSVDEGQTVVSSMNAVGLLTIAEDLKTIWIEASVPEADVGAIREGQTVSFTADAYRDRFTGVVRQVRISSTTTNNVVTYPIIVEAANTDEKLFPGMTVTLTIETDRADDALAVTQAAFRFRPKDKETELRGKKLWLVKDDGDIEAVQPEFGVSDTSFTQVKDDSLEGRLVAIGYETSNVQSGAGTSNPFMPKPPQRGKNKGTAPAPKQ
jgi:HlyD family secretion protein